MSGPRFCAAIADSILRPSTSCDLSTRPPHRRLDLATRLLLVFVWALPSATTTAQDHPRRIVSLAPSVTEVLFEAGLGSRVVGVTSYCTFPRQVLGLPKVGGYLTPSYEALIALHPDLVVTLPEHADLEPRLRALGLPVLRLDHRSLDGIVRSIEQAGKRCGAAPAANRAANALRQTLRKLRRDGTGPRPRVLISFGRADDIRQLTAAAPGTIYDDLVEHAGGTNVLTSRVIAYPTLSAESVLRLDPDVIIEFSSGRTDAAVLRRQWNRLDSVRAVKTGRVYVFADEFLSVPGPRLVRFAETVARAIQGDR
jgi:iron complex transport system substrate-binding protein